MATRCIVTHITLGNKLGVRGHDVRCTLPHVVDPLLTLCTLHFCPSLSPVPMLHPDLVFVGGVERNLCHLGVSVPHLPHGATGQLNTLEQS